MWVSQLSFSKRQRRQRIRLEKDVIQWTCECEWNVRKHIQVKVFHKLIRPQFRHHARLCYSTSCSRPYVDYREYTQYQELNWTETARTKEQRPIHCVRCQVVMANGMPIAATCACANWSSWMCVYGNSQRSNRHRQRLCSELESTICSHISII